MNRVLTREKTLFSIAVIFAFGAAVFWLATSWQPLIDQHEFRQAQTAVTSLYLQPSIKGLFNYETPVLGSPWSIPFEFPLYQLLVYWTGQLLPLPLHSAGRLLSALFGLLCIFPAQGLMQLFRIKKNGQYCFFVLYFSSSIYLYWNRTFMIESTALFFTLSSLYLYSKLRLSAGYPYNSFGGYPISYFLFFMALLLGLLTKVTTILPSFILIAFDLLTNAVVRPTLSSRSSALSWRKIILCSICLAVSFFVLKSWLTHADSLKSMNQIGQSLTSEALTDWNYGTLKQRFGKALWGSVVVGRMLTPVGFVPALFLILVPICASLSRQKAFRIEIVFILGCIFLWLAPLLLFTNLHLVHDYYQCANQVFLLMALAASFSEATEIVDDSRIKSLIFFSICIFVVGSLINFSYSSGYLRASIMRDSSKLVAGKIIQDNTPNESAILVVGDDWSSAFSYHSRRRSLSLPDWQKVYSNPQEALDRSEEWLGGNSLGAIIERANDKQRLSLSSICNPKIERQVGEWKLSICS
jgi:hypothetical protein